MPQSILIVAAAVILGLLGLSRHESRARDNRAIEQQEIEAAALRVAETWASAARDLAFDAADASASEVRVRNDTDGLSATLGPETGEVATDPRTFNDVDDYNGFARTETVPLGAGAGTATFIVSVEVIYARPTNWLPAFNPTTAKLATVTVREAGTQERGRNAVQVQLPVRFTPAQQFVRG